MEKFCQSCGMPLLLHGEDVRGTEVDGTKSNNYCNFCYLNGTFIEPDITMDEMLIRGKAAIRNGKGNTIMKWMMITFYPMQLRNLKRWKK
ncbi:zinc ribbon domain-containing protein [Macrococcoides canis]|uniref:zinc ribbon domain-containing protein n=1 Tax=Macrococcoides canis TaxID=1855823 RepID=UPI0022B8C5D5|nr:zinc ribbon domain-containing protein [Macrococcus canis]WBF52540.1 zinc ribbon domain-containing protein [Macrococcus canis]